MEKHTRSDMEMTGGLELPANGKGAGENGMVWRLHRPTPAEIGAANINGIHEYF